jgi:predicted dehydrogenase
MASSTTPVPVRVGIVGCGQAARIHLGRLRALPGVQLVGVADPSPEAAAALLGAEAGAVPTFTDHRELLRGTNPDAVAIFTPHRAHYRPAMDALQAGCHVFIEKPLATNPQEAVDIVGLARGRSRKVAVGHQYRLCPAFVEARRLLAAGAIGPLRLVTATLARPWLAEHSGPEDSWRLDPKVSGGGILADTGDHLLDTLVWTTGRAAVEVAAFQARSTSGLDLVTAAALRLAGGAPATLALSGVSPGEGDGSLFELVFHGETGRLRATESALHRQAGGGAEADVPLPAAGPSIDANFVAAVRGEAELCCPAEAALDTVALLEAIARSAAGGQIVRLA